MQLHNVVNCIQRDSTAFYPPTKNSSLPFSSTSAYFQLDLQQYQHELTSSSIESAAYSSTSVASTLSKDNPRLLVQLFQHLSMVNDLWRSIYRQEPIDWRVSDLEALLNTRRTIATAYSRKVYHREYRLCSCSIDTNLILIANHALKRCLTCQGICQWIWI